MTYHITQAQNEMTVERYLLDQGYSQGLIRHLRNTENGLTIDGKLVYTTHKLVCGEILTALLEDEESSKTYCTHSYAASKSYMRMNIF